MNYIAAIVIATAINFIGIFYTSFALTVLWDILVLKVFPDLFVLSLSQAFIFTFLLGFMTAKFSANKTVVNKELFIEKLTYEFVKPTTALISGYIISFII